MPKGEAIRVHTFTTKGNGILNCLHTPVEIATPSVNTPYNQIQKISTRGIWDTGATNTVITQNVVKQLGLKETGKTLTNTASEKNKQVSTYIVDVYLKPDLRIMGVQVTEGTLVDGIDCLIGMDIIALGDFSITNYLKKTTMSFRIPSLHEIDYNAAQTGVKTGPEQIKIGRNDPCPCGSGKKYKNCCLRHAV